MSVRSHLEDRDRARQARTEAEKQRAQAVEAARKQKYERWNSMVRDVFAELAADRDYIATWGYSVGFVAESPARVVLAGETRNLVIAYTDDWGFELYRVPCGCTDLGAEGTAQYFWEASELERAIATAIAEGSVG